MPEGRVVQSVGGFQTVLSAEGRAITCTARGRIRREQGGIVVGDLVDYTTGPATAVVEAIRPRRNLLRRPLVANVDQAVLVFALCDPEPSKWLIDRFIVAVSAAGLPILLCLNKVDLVRPRDAQDLADCYRGLGFRTIQTSALTRKGRNKLLACLYGLASVFCGPSGVGKSALLNMVRPGLALPTGETSTKIGRGRHTTRMARLMPIGRDGFVVDTPGFTQVELAGLAPRELAGLFPEMEAVGSPCQFNGCLHLEEPGCAIKAALAGGTIPTTRYDHYRQFMAEIAANSGKGWRREGR